MRIKINTYYDEDQFKKIKAMADETEITMARLMRKALKQFLEREEEKKHGGKANK